MKLSLVIPTYNEKKNIGELITKIQHEFKSNLIEGQIIVVDDNSPDGTGKILDTLKRKWGNLKVIHRRRKQGLSSAVLRGWKIANGDVLGVMDADLSHPPEKIAELFSAIGKGADIAIGSRYIKKGRIEGWNLKRRLMSSMATFLSRIYTKINDPLTGFFMIKKGVIKNIDLNPKGFKILLEIIVKGKYKTVREIPITFVNRVQGESKAGLNEVFYYLINLAGYLHYKKDVIREFFKFGAVGSFGALINIAILYLLTEKAGIYYIVSAIFAFAVAMSSNFILNKTWTFKEKIRAQIGKKYLQFGLISISALLVNLFFLYIFTEILGIYYIISQILAISIAMIINFSGNKIWTFRK